MSPDCVSRMWLLLVRSRQQWRMLYDFLLKLALSLLAVEKNGLLVCGFSSILSCNIKTTFSICVGALMDSHHLSIICYIDPGAGSMFLQFLLGGIAGLWFIAKVWGKRILNKLGLRKNETSDQT